MALSRPQRQGLTPLEVEFMATERLIEMVPLFKMDSIKNLDMDMSYGPFEPPQKTKVPLWMAIHLKKRKKCRIIIPLWLTVGELEQTLRVEKDSAEFSALPDDYIEVAKAVLEVASDDVNSPDKIRILLKDIREIRQAKVREGITALNPVHLSMPHASTMEINEIRAFFSAAFKHLRVLHPDVEQHNEREARWEKNQVAAAAGEYYYEEAVEGEGDEMNED